jgi:N-acetylmuramoyl-L-alanine amidase
LINNNLNTNLKPKTGQVNAKTISKKVRYRKGKGDCWDNSEILYKKLKNSGQQVRIIQYRTSFSPRHRSVQIYKNGAWVDYNYKSKGYAKRYSATKYKPRAHVIK